MISPASIGYDLCARNAYACERVCVCVCVEFSGSGVSGPACAVPVHLLMVLHWGQ